MQEKAERHQGKHFPIAHYQLREKPGTESRKYLPQHIQRSGEIGIAEEYPAEANEVERNDDTEEAADATTAFALLPSGNAHPELMDSQSNAMQHAPKHKIPGSPMPQAAQKHGNDKVGILRILPLRLPPRDI